MLPGAAACLQGQQSRRLPDGRRVWKHRRRANPRSRQKSNCSAIIDTCALPCLASSPLPTSLHHDYMVTVARLDLGILWLARRAGLEAVRDFLKVSM